MLVALAAGGPTISYTRRSSSVLTVLLPDSDCGTRGHDVFRNLGQDGAKPGVDGDRVGRRLGDDGFGAGDGLAGEEINPVAGGQIDSAAGVLVDDGGDEQVGGRRGTRL